MLIQTRVVHTIFENVVYRISYMVYNDTYTMINRKNIYDTYTKYTKIYDIVSIVSVGAVIWYGKDCKITRKAVRINVHELSMSVSSVNKDMVKGKPIYSYYSYIYNITRFGIWQNLFYINTCNVDIRIIIIHRYQLITIIFKLLI